MTFYGCLHWDMCCVCRHVSHASDRQLRQSRLAFAFVDALFLCFTNKQKTEKSNPLRKKVVYQQRQHEIKPSNFRNLCTSIYRTYPVDFTERTGTIQSSRYNGLNSQVHILQMNSRGPPRYSRKRTKLCRMCLVRQIESSSFCEQNLSLCLRLINPSAKFKNTHSVFITQFAVENVNKDYKTVPNPNNSSTVAKSGIISNDISM